MSSELAKIIQAGNDITSTKYYEIAGTTILFYEYFAMLPDEIRYARSPNKTWVFYLFLLNRYVPMVFQFQFLSTAYGQGFSQETSFIGILIFVACSLLAQIALTLRIYAVTGKSRPIAATFVTVTVFQLALGTYATFLAATHPAETLPPIPFDSFRICFFSRHRRVEVAFTVLSLVYDLLAFSVIICLAGRSTIRRSGLSGLLGTIVRDATIYFFVIFSSHLALAMTLIFARPSLQLLPGGGVVVYLPVMITRLMISLRRAARSQESAWSTGEFTRNSGLEAHSMRFASNRGALDRCDDVTLDAFD